MGGLGVENGKSKVFIKVFPSLDAKHSRAFINYGGTAVSRVNDFRFSVVDLLGRTISAVLGINLGKRG